MKSRIIQVSIALVLVLVLGAIVVYAAAPVTSPLGDLASIVTAIDRLTTAVSNISSIAGPQGEQGPQGPQGPAGPAGASDIEVITGRFSPRESESNVINVPEGYTFDQCKIFVSPSEFVNNLADEAMYQPIYSYHLVAIPYPETGTPTGWYISDWVGMRGTDGYTHYTESLYINYMIICQK